MKIVLIGGNGLVGTRVGEQLRRSGHEVVAASRASGVDAVSGAGLREALAGADVVVDVLNSPSFEPAAVLRFFETTTKNLLAAEAATGVKHHVALSVVGVDRGPENDYFRAKHAQERLITASAIPYTIVRATQFFEFAAAIGDSSTDGRTCRVPPARMQPIAVDDVAAAIAEVATGAPQNRVVDLAGPEPIAMDDLVRRVLRAKGDPREVVTDPQARYFGAATDDEALVPAGEAMIAPTRLDDWLARTMAR